MFRIIAHLLNTIVGSSGINVDVFVQKCPGPAATFGIAGLAYEIKIEGRSAVTGTTGGDGKITVSSWNTAKKCVVKVLDTEYELQHLPLVEPVTTREGVKRRLEIIGYYSGAVDSSLDANTERAVLHFQADHSNLRVDGVAGTRTKNELTSTVGY